MTVKQFEYFGEILAIEQQGTQEWLIHTPWTSFRFFGTAGQAEKQAKQNVKMNVLAS